MVYQIATNISTDKDKYNRMNTKTVSGILVEEVVSSLLDHNQIIWYW